MTQMNLSARPYTARCQRILKLERTIGDLAVSEDIQSVHLAEALHAAQTAEDDDGVEVLQIFQGRYICK